MKSRYDSGAAPVMIRICPSGVIEAGADPFYFRVCASVVGPLFDEPECVRPRRAWRIACALAAQKIYIGGSSWKYEGWLGQIYSRERYLSRGRFSKKVFEAECLREYAETFPMVCGDFAFYQFPTEEFWRQAVRADAAVISLRLQGAGTDHLQSVSRARALRAQAGRDNEAFLDAACLPRNVSASAAAVPREDGGA